MTSSIKEAIQKRNNPEQYYLDRLEKILVAQFEQEIENLKKQAAVDLQQAKEKLLADMQTFISKEQDSVSKKMLENIVKGMLDQMKGADGRDGKDSIVPGPKGEKGDSVTGPMGPKPVAGIDYPIPKNGKDGNDSQVPGPAGPPGSNGRDGSPDKPLEIAAKLNTTEESVEMSVIKGLKTYLANLTRSIKEKSGGGGKSGGGMGNVVHQSIGISSATTTVATSQKIGGGGYALWVYYNGQLIARGVGYTVGGDQRTLTLLFTPQDSTAIDIIYIRS